MKLILLNEALKELRLGVDRLKVLRMDVQQKTLNAKLIPKNTAKCKRSNVDGYKQNKMINQFGLLINYCVLALNY